MAAKTRTILTSLERLERQLQAITPDRAQGDAWEKALKGWINAGGHPELTKAWMWGEWPGKLKAGLKGDKGVDLVAETRDKQLVAIQVKFRRDPNDPVTAPEVQKLVGSYRKHFTLFALASNAWSATRGVSEAVGDEDAMLILREQLLESSYDWAAKKSIKRTKFTPFPFQKVAAENVRKALAKGGRAQIVMACGTGKTVTMLLAAEALDAQRVLVLAPTLLLVKQLRDEWISKRRPDREWASLAVCSDIGDGVDASEIAPAEFGAPPTTNPDDIAAFLKKPGRRVVFGTYASSDRIAKAQKKAGVPAFDLAVADEAHRIAGVVSAKDKSERSQRVMLEEKEIKAVRRLFATATPRITGSKKTRDGDEILIESMDDESRFGKVAHSVTFHEAVKLKRLVPYKLVVTIVTDDDVAEAVHNRKFIDVNGKTYGTDEVATAIAIRRAYKDLGISKIISYHSRVAGARAFADLITQVPGRGKSPVTEHVAGSMPVNDRKQVLNRLAAASEPYLVTNARCLTEGIDVPALDAVAFADPRKSQVDIVQAVGRAMRRPMGKSSKTTGYIILPVYLLKQDLNDPEAAVEGSAFEPVLQVLRALKDHDPFMARFMARVLVQKGKRPHQKGKGIEEILEVSVSDALDALLSKKLGKAIELRALEVAAGNFELGCAFLASYVAEFGNALVPAKSSYRNFRLGPWVSNKRADYFAGQLSTDVVKALEVAGMVWDVFESQWQEGYLALSDFLKNHKFAEISPATTTKAGFRIGGWVTVQRSAWREGKMSPSRVAALESLTGWDWAPRGGAWARTFEVLREYVAINGTAQVPQGKAYAGVGLGSWVASQRRSYKKQELSEEQIVALEGLKGWTWTPRSDTWTAGYIELLQYVEKHNAADFSNHFVSTSGFKLGQWATVRRQNYRNGKLSKREILDLESVRGWSWSKLEDNFEVTVQAILRWQKSNGPGLPGVAVVFEDVPIGQRVTKYLGAKRTGDLSTTEVKALEKIPGWGWSRIELRTGKRVREVASHLRANGTFAGMPEGLAQWVRGVRSHYLKGGLSASLTGQLEAIPGWSWTPYEESWDAHYDALVRWKAVNGHCKPKTSEVFNCLKIGSWVHVQSQNFKAGTLLPARVKKLDALGAEWRLGRHEYLWETAFRATEKYAQETGGLSIPQGKKVDGVDITAWVSHQRARIKSGAIPKHQYSRLKTIPGWQDDPLQEQYALGLAAVRSFAAEFGHARVPQDAVFNGFDLGTWVAIRRQQYSKHRLSLERIRELERIPGWAWNANDADWEALLARLKAYKAQFGTFAASRDYVDTEGNRVGLAIQNLRRRLPSDETRLKQLKKIGFK